MRAATTTPVEPSGADLARLPDDGGLPQHYDGSASTLIVSRPAQCSLTLRPAWPTAPQKGTFPGVLQTIRRLLIRPGCFRLERELPGGICTHGTSAPWQGTQNAYQKAGGRNGQQQRDGVAGVEADDHERPASDERQDRGRQLGEAEDEARRLVGVEP